MRGGCGASWPPEISMYFSKLHMLSTAGSGHSSYTTIDRHLLNTLPDVSGSVHTT